MPVRASKEFEGDVPHRAELAEEVEELLWGDVEAAAKSVSNHMQ
jgi:hypothetical protein